MWSNGTPLAGESFQITKNKEGFPGGSAGKESLCHAGDLGSIPESGRPTPPEKGMATYSSVLARGIPWTEELDGLQSIGSQKSRTRLK